MKCELKCYICDSTKIISLKQKLYLYTMMMMMLFFIIIQTDTVLFLVWAILSFRHCVNTNILLTWKNINIVEQVVCLKSMHENVVTTNEMLLYKFHIWNIIFVVFSFKCVHMFLVCGNKRDEYFVNKSWYKKYMLIEADS